MTTKALKTARGRSLDTGAAFVGAVRSLLAESDTDFTVTAVVARSGHSLRAFYSHFDGKDDLLLAVIEEISRDQAERALVGLDRDAGSLERIGHMVSTIYRSSTGVRSHEATFLSREHLRLVALDPAGVQTASAPLVDVFESELVRGRERGEVRDCDLRRAAEMIVNVVASEVNVALAGLEGPIPPEEVALFCCGAVRRGTS